MFASLIFEKQFGPLPVIVLLFLSSSSDKLTEASIQELHDNHGFTFNTRRGTAHFFSCEALCAFLERNGLSHVIRAHEVQETGFKVRPVIYLS